MTKELKFYMEDEQSRLTAPEAANEEVVFDITLRPQKLEDFIGQAQIKQNLGISMQAANKRGDMLEHILLYGNPGLGKPPWPTLLPKK